MPIIPKFNLRETGGMIHLRHIIALVTMIFLMSAYSACQRGHSSREQMHQRSQNRGRMMNKMEGMGQSSDNRPSAKQNIASPDGKKLYTQYCSSCHGTGGKGMAGAFPPLVNAKWITTNKTVPIKILLHGVQGEMQVQDRTYGGTMNSYGDQLSNAEIAAILNYLRSESEADVPTITKQDVKKIKDKYSERSSPWTAQELLPEK